MKSGKRKTFVVLDIVSVAACALFSAAILLGGDDCKCRRPEKGEETHWGGNEMIVVKEGHSYRRLTGTITMPDGRPLESALVEVFDSPDYLLDESWHGQPHPQKKLAACRTSAGGKFCFRHLSSGVYELRSSIGNGWNVTHVYIEVDTKTGSDKDVQVVMTMGT